MGEFETLLAAARTALERFVRSRVSSRADAEDILQETYLAAYRGFPELKNRDVFLPWALGIARRKCADWYRMKWTGSRTAWPFSIGSYAWLYGSP